MENVVLAKIVLKLMEKCGKTLEKFSTVKRKQPRGILPSWMSSSQLEIVGGFKASGFNPEECEPIVFIQVYPLIISINTRMCVYVCVYKYVYIYTPSREIYQFAMENHHVQISSVNHRASYAPWHKLLEDTLR